MLHRRTLKTCAGLCAVYIDGINHQNLISDIMLALLTLSLV